jgi:regulator of protease activity HflC (stomatin/prohibitin superfamily)
MSTFVFLLLVFAGILVIKGVKIVQQAEVIIIERLGRYNRTLESGFNFIIPIIEVSRFIHWKTTKQIIGGGTVYQTETRERIDLREAVYEFPKQNVITKDNVSVIISALLYFQIVDAKSAVYEIYNLPEAIEKLTQTTLRNIIGELDLDQTLVSRDTINAKLRAILDDASNKWGVKVNRVELQDILPPKDIQQAMEKQMKAERDKRAAIIEAEGLKTAAILKSEGVRQSEITTAEGDKAANVLRAEGQAEARVKIAQAESEAIKKVIEAIADKGDPDKYLIAVRYLDTLKEMVSGKDNKVVYMPFEATGILSSIDGIKQMLDRK